MRITTKVIQNNTLSNINNNKILQDRLSNQMGTEKKINRPSEDPIIAIRALNGGYLTVQNGKPTGFNPFALENNTDNVQFLISFVKLLLSMDNQPITAAEELLD